MLPAHRHRHFHFVLWFAIFLLGCNSHRPVLVLVLVVFWKSPKNGIDRPASNRRSFVCHSRDRIVMEARKAKRNGKTRQYKTEGKKFFGFLLKERKKKKKKTDVLLVTASDVCNDVLFHRHGHVFAWRQQWNACAPGVRASV